DEAIGPPDEVLDMVLKVGHFGFQRVDGIINAPSMRPDGSIISTSGYDTATHLWCQPDRELILPPIPERPTQDEARAALKDWKELLSECAFVNKLDWAVALAALLTAVLRAGFVLAPMFLFLAHTPGTGKSYLIDIIATIVTGRWCPVISYA